MVERHTPPGHIGHLRLDFQSGEMLSPGLGLQKNRDDAGAGTQIGRPLPLPYSRVAGEQHRVHPEAESFLILNDPVSIAVQIIQALMFL